MRTELDQALAASTIDDRDQAAVHLARLLADQLDANPDRLEALAPKLLAVLRSLHLTPDSRKGAAPNDGNTDDSEAALAEVLQLVRTN